MYTIGTYQNAVYPVPVLEGTSATIYSITIPEFIYTVLLKPRPLRVAANSVLRAIIPSSIAVGKVRIVLNPHDPVVSGAIALRVYERRELAFVRCALAAGMTILDIGANLGFYTAIFAEAVGDGGKVIAFEPDPENFHFLHKTIEANSFSNVVPINAAAARRSGIMRLYTSRENRGDNRLYANELSDGSVDVKVLCLDEYLPGIGVKEVDFIKIDVQGFEGEVLGGLEQTIRSSRTLTMLAEFWPQGLRRAGTDPLELLERLESYGLSLNDLGDHGRTTPVTDKKALIARYQGREYTNIVARKPAV